MNSGLKGKIGLMTASVPMLCFLACTSILARVSEAFPDTRVETVQLLVTVAQLVSLVTSIFVGRLTAFFYKRTMMLVTGLIYPVCGLIIYFYHPSVTAIIIFTALMGFASGVRVPSIPALISDCYEGETSARLIGMQGGFISMGAMLFTWLGSILAKNDWTKCYLVFLLVIVTLIIEFFCLPKGKLEKRKEKGEKKERVPTSVYASSIFIFFACFFVCTFNTNISMLIELRGLGGTVETGYTTTIYNFFGILSGIATGFLVTKIHRRIYSIGVAAGVLGAVFCFFGGSLFLLCVGGALSGICFSTVIPAGNYFASVDASDYNRSLCVAIPNAGSAFGQFLSPILLGWAMSGLEMTKRVPMSYSIAAIGFALLLIFSVLYPGFVKNQQK